MVIATSDEELRLGSPLIPGSSFTARRPTLYDQDGSLFIDEMISYYKPGQNIPPFEKTTDPMKIYAKFMAFWMNYKNIFIMEYLNGFKDLNYRSPIAETEAGRVRPRRNDEPDSQFTDKAKMPKWDPITAEIIANVSKTQSNLFCRVRRLAPEDMFPALASLGNNAAQASQFFNSERFFDLETYNKYFFLSNSISTKEKPPPTDDPDPEYDLTADTTLGGLVGSNSSPSSTY